LRRQAGLAYLLYHHQLDHPWIVDTSESSFDSFNLLLAHADTFQLYIRKEEPISVFIARAILGALRKEGIDPDVPVVPSLTY
jgi:hypothetical protein